MRRGGTFIEKYVSAIFHAQSVVRVAMGRGSALRVIHNAAALDTSTLAQITHLASIVNLAMVGLCAFHLIHSVAELEAGRVVQVAVSGFRAFQNMHLFAV
jgi:hypothetical protein